MTSCMGGLGKKAQWLEMIQPKTVLDIGFGGGLFGLLLRDRCELIHGRITSKDWEVYLEGIEAWGPYALLPWVDVIYDVVQVGDVYDYVSNYPGEHRQMQKHPFFCYNKFNWDLIHAGDVIEHLEKEKAQEVVEWCFEHTDNLIIQLPLGQDWAVHDPKMPNPYEVHKSAWEMDEFMSPTESVLMPSPLGGIWLAWWRMTND